MPMDADTTSRAFHMAATTTATIHSAAAVVTFPDTRRARRTATTLLRPMSHRLRLPQAVIGEATARPALLISRQLNHRAASHPSLAERRRERRHREAPLSNTIFNRLSRRRSDTPLRAPLHSMAQPPLAPAADSRLRPKPAMALPEHKLLLQPRLNLQGPPIPKKQRPNQKQPRSSGNHRVPLMGETLVKLAAPLFFVISKPEGSAEHFHIDRHGGSLRRVCSAEISHPHRM